MCINQEMYEKRMWISRGYGAIKFDELKAETIFGDYDVTALNTKLGEQDGI